MEFATKVWQTMEPVHVIRGGLDLFVIRVQVVIMARVVPLVPLVCMVAAIKDYREMELALATQDGLLLSVTLAPRIITVLAVLFVHLA